MKNLIVVLPLLFCAPGCKAVDAAFGLGSGSDNSEEVISAGESAIRTTGDMLIPGAGGALAVLFGLGARAYVKKRKATKPA